MGAGMQGSNDIVLGCLDRVRKHCMSQDLGIHGICTDRELKPVINGLDGNCLSLPRSLTRTPYEGIGVFFFRLNEHHVLHVTGDDASRELTSRHRAHEQQRPRSGRTDSLRFQTELSHVARSGSGRDTGNSVYNSSI